MRFSANIGFLYGELGLLDRIKAAARDGFDAVECHWPYDIPASELREVLLEVNLPMLGLNTKPGDLTSGEFGIAAMPDRRVEARNDIRVGLKYGAEMGAANLHVMAGRTGGGHEAEKTFRDNLRFASDLADQYGMTILIEPINQRDCPNYHLSTIEHAAEIIDSLQRPNLKLMFDCYHVQVCQGDLTRRLRDFFPLIGHVQIAAVPGRGEPDLGEVAFLDLMMSLRGLGYTGIVGAEYKPRSRNTEIGLTWLAAFRTALSAMPETTKK